MATPYLYGSTQLNESWALPYEPHPPERTQIQVVGAIVEEVGFALYGWTVNAPCPRTPNRSPPPQHALTKTLHRARTLAGPELIPRGNDTP
jgi:hypothetical protein